MPATGTRLESALPGRIRLHLLDNPGTYRPAQVAHALGVPDGMTRAEWSQKVANAMARLARDGSLAKVDLREQLGWKGKCTGYHLPGIPPPPYVGADVSPEPEKV